MGHVRIGFLPHTQQWNAIVNQISTYDNSVSTVAIIADRTLNAIRKEYENLQYDESIKKAIRYLSGIIVSSRQDNQIDFLQKNGYVIDGDITLFSLIACSFKALQTEDGSLETNKLVKDATVQAIMKYYQYHSEDQLSLFEPGNNPFTNKGSGREFCELARLFFASFTEKQIRYYIDREASRVIDDFTKYTQFSKSLTDHSVEVSKHAFDISQIMQSFAAGWFNKYALDRIPSESCITEFLRIALGKMREEFRLEAIKDE